MRRGTTPTHIFTLPFDTATLSKVRIIYSQGNSPVVTRDNADLHGNTATVKLTQAETLKFDSVQTVSVQVRVLTVGGDALASDIMRTTADRLLENEVLE